LKKSHGGRFEVFLEDDLVFSKANEYRFPEPGEIENILKEKIG
jgi:selT/selW/selH-like putative selenoprotein